MDLQPLLQQLGARLAPALRGGGAAALSSLRRQCQQEDGGAVAQASVQVGAGQGLVRCDVMGDGG